MNRAGYRDLAATCRARRFVALACLPLVAASGCGQLGYTARILWEVPSPDGQLLAVCQEVPFFDGPGHELRLEDGAGRVIRSFFGYSDADPCDELVWSANGGRLAMVTRHDGTVRILDVARALAHDSKPGTVATGDLWHVSSFSDAETLRRAWNARFVSAVELQVEVCAYSLDAYRQTQEFRCALPAETRTIGVEMPSMPDRGPGLQGAAQHAAGAGGRLRRSQLSR
jgi:hypothetical protein